MQLTPLALHLLEYSSKEKRNWCIVIEKSSWIWIYINDSYWIFKNSFWDNDVIFVNPKLNIIDILGNPYWRGRVCMLYYKDDSDTIADRPTDLEKHFNKNPELYDMDCLSWDPETQKLVLEFLQSLPINK